MRVATLIVRTRPGRSRVPIAVPFSTSWSFPMRQSICEDDPCDLFYFKSSGYLSLAGSFLLIALRMYVIFVISTLPALLILAASVAVWNKSRTVVMLTVMHVGSLVYGGSLLQTFRSLIRNVVLFFFFFEFIRNVVPVRYPTGE